MLGALEKGQLTEADEPTHGEQMDPQFDDVQQLSIIQNEGSPDTWSPRLDQNGLKPPQVKEEQEEADIIAFTFSPASVNSEDDEEKPLSLGLHLNQAEESRDSVGPKPDLDWWLESNHEDKTSNASEKDVCDGNWGERGEHLSGLNAFRNRNISVGDTRCEEGVQQILVTKEEFPLEQHNQNSVDQEVQTSPHIKEEQKEVDVTKFTFSSLPVKSGDGEENPQPSKLHHSWIVENRGTSAPDEHLESDSEDQTSDSLEVENGNRNWEESSHLNSLGANKVPVESDRRFYSCTECDRTFDYRWRLLRHNRIHTGEKPFSCSVCGQRFRRKDSVTSHMTCHTGEKPLCCPICKATFRWRYVLVEHIKIHTGGKSFSCSVCTKTFSRKQDLVKHTVIHTEDRPFSCSICNAAFRRKHDLVKHTKEHTNDRPFTCSVCSAAFKRKYALVEHTRTHTGEKPFCCSVCDQSFSQKSTLTRHMRCHTGEKPFSCSVCKETFRWRNVFLTHTRTHCGEKSFSCSDCNAAFGNEQDFVEHTKIHTG